MARRAHLPTQPFSRLVVSLAISLAILWLLPVAIGGLRGTQRAAAASDPVIGAAGDIACDPAASGFNGGLGVSTRCRQKYTSDILVNAGLAAILDLGDNQYECGGYNAFLQSYDLSWGRIKSITHPAPGNHEYLTSGGTDCSTSANAAGYFQYFGAAAGTPGQGYYSFDVGSWHMIALNTSCSDVGGCGTSSAQYKWLQSDLATHTNYCTLAYWHIPLFSSGGRAASNSQQFWNLLYANNADLILNGHDHIYERFAPQTPTGASDPVRGIRQFTVGTGGGSHTGFSTIAANSEVRNDDTFGILELTLHASGYDWNFVPESGKTFTDSGSGTCHGSNPPTPTPTTASAPSSTPTATSAVASATPTVGASPTPTRTPAASPTPTATSSSGSSVTFVPGADAYVNSSYPDTNYGTGTTLRVDGSPYVHSFLRFSVSGLNGLPITSAQLRLYANTSSSSGITAAEVADNTWGETTITYNNMPAAGTVLATSTAVTGGTWISLNVSPYVVSEGTYSFRLSTAGGTAISLASRESGANAPQLILTLGP